MATLALLPAWVPSDALLVAIVVFIAAVLLMNRGDWWVLNVLAQDEPLVVAFGVLVAALSPQITAELGTGTQEMWMVVGLLIAISGVVVWRSDRFDISGLI